jgi:predicted DsbA family dithiol-disulfide isomerase
MHDRLLANQESLEPKHLIAHAEAIGLDVDRFTSDLRRHAGAAHVAEDVDGADLSGVSGTPTFFIDGRRHHGSYDLETLSVAVERAGARASVR